MIEPTTFMYSDFFDALAIAFTAGEDGWEMSESKKTSPSYESVRRLLRVLLEHEYAKHVNIQDMFTQHEWECITLMIEECYV